MADALLDMLERPDAPNLYWALSVLPRPLLNLRQEYETEQRLLEMEFPDMAELDRPRSAEDWEATLARARPHMNLVTESDRNKKPVKPGDQIHMRPCAGQR